MIGFLKGLINPEDKERDVKLLAFAGVAIFGISKLAASPITDQWVNAFYGLCAMVGGGGAIWAAVDKWKGNLNGSSPTKNAGASDEGGKP